LASRAFKKILWPRGGERGKGGLFGLALRFGQSQAGFCAGGRGIVIHRVHSKHRQAALPMITALIDRLKNDVPVWKPAVMI
jgi:hypothetical protein